MLEVTFFPAKKIEDLTLAFLALRYVKSDSLRDDVLEIKIIPRTKNVTRIFTVNVEWELMAIPWCRMDGYDILLLYSICLHCLRMQTI